MNSMKSKEAKKLFRSGAGCAQAILGAFYKECGLEYDQAMRLASSFGAGMGRMREVCGAVSGMLMVSGLIEGPSKITSKTLKDRQYQRVQSLAHAVKKHSGSLICRELLGLPEGPDTPVSKARTVAFYAQRPCEALIGRAAEILEQHLRKKKKHSTQNASRSATTKRRNTP